MPNFPTTAASLRDQLKDIGKRLFDDFDGDNIMFTIAADVNRLNASLCRLEDRRANHALRPPLDPGAVQTESTPEERKEQGIPEGDHVVETPQEKLENATRPSRTGRRQSVSSPSPRGPRNG